MTSNQWHYLVACKKARKVKPPCIRRAEALAVTIPDDGGRTPGRKLDCTVRALAICAGIPYKAAEALARKAGRRTNHGFPCLRLIDHAVKAGYAFTPWPHKRCRLATFLKQHKIGRFYVRVANHAFAVIDGKAHDTFPNPLACIVTHAWVYSGAPTPWQDRTKQPVDNRSSLGDLKS